MFRDFVSGSFFPSRKPSASPVCRKTVIHLKRIKRIMSFVNFHHRHEKSRRDKRNEAINRKRYREWCRRKPEYVRVRQRYVVLSSPPSPPPIYRNASLDYLRSHTSEGNGEAYEWVNKGCLIGLREI